MPEFRRPKLTNRGPSGLYDKLTDGTRKGLIPSVVSQRAELTIAVASNRIAPALKHLAVPIEGLILDPTNARLHPERNLEEIKRSLTQYGQLKPLVVRKSTNTVIAGNGTLEAAKDLGWTEIAVNFVDMNEVEAAGYGLADNRTAELAKWDYEIVARLDKLLLEAGHATVGWSKDELEVLRAADWVPPAIEEDITGSNGENQSLTLKLTEEQRALFNRVLDNIRAIRFEEDGLDEGKCFELMCLQWLGEEEEEGEN